MTRVLMKGDFALIFGEKSNLQRKSNKIKQNKMDCTRLVEEIHAQYQVYQYLA